MDDLTFEAALRELEETVTKLEVGELSLEQALALYERGQRLVSHCSGQLEQAQLRVSQITAGGYSMFDDD